MKYRKLVLYLQDKVDTPSAILVKKVKKQLMITLTEREMQGVVKLIKRKLILDISR